MNPNLRAFGQRLCGFLAVFCWLAAVPALVFTGFLFLDSGPHGAFGYARYLFGLFTLVLIANGYLFYRLAHENALRGSPDKKDGDD